MQSADALEDDFVFEKVGSEVSDQEAEVVSPEPLPKSAEPSKKPKKSKKRETSFEDLGIEVQSSPDHSSLMSLLDALYVNQPKPLYVKTHKKLKVIVVCSSAKRSLDLTRELKTQNPNLKVAKLFSKHLKVTEQLKQLKENPFLVGIGTPNRILKLVTQPDQDSIDLRRIDFLIIDGAWRDAKSFNILELKEVVDDLVELCKVLQDKVQGVYNLDGQ